MRSGNSDAPRDTKIGYASVHPQRRGSPLVSRIAMAMAVFGLVTGLLAGHSNVNLVEGGVVSSWLANTPLFYLLLIVTLPGLFAAMLLGAIVPSYTMVVATGQVVFYRVAGAGITALLRGVRRGRRY